MSPAGPVVQRLYPIGWGVKTAQRSLQVTPNVLLFMVRDSILNSLQLSRPGSPLLVATRRATWHLGMWRSTTADNSSSFSSEEDPELLGFSFLGFFSFVEQCVQVAMQAITWVKRQTHIYPFFKMAIPSPFMEEF